MPSKSKKRKINPKTKTVSGNSIFNNGRPMSLNDRKCSISKAEPSSLIFQAVIGLERYNYHWSFAHVHYQHQKLFFIALKMMINNPINPIDNEIIFIRIIRLAPFISRYVR